MKTIPESFNVQSPSYSSRAVRAAFQRDGAVILTHLHQAVADTDDKDSNDLDWSATAAAVPLRVWEADDLRLGRSGHRADAVHVEHAALSLSGQALAPHTDGYVWGDDFPDVVILVCEQPAVAGEGADESNRDTRKEEKEELPSSKDTIPGANFLLDGHDVLAQLDDKTRHLLETTLIDHTERSETALVDGAESIIPLIRWINPQSWRKQALEDLHSDDENSKQLCWRRMVGKSYASGMEYYQPASHNGSHNSNREDIPYTSLWTPVATDDTTAAQQAAVNQALHAVDRAIAHTASQAPRFALQRGQALLVDNYRLLHAREGFAGHDATRRMWRVWAWTTATHGGLPPSLLAPSTGSDEVSTAAGTPGSATSRPAANILEAQQSIRQYSGH